MAFINKDRVLLLTAMLCVVGSCLSAGMLFFLPSSSVNSDFDVTPASIQDIGQVRQGTSTEVRYSLKNASQKPLKIVEVSTTCGCTTASLSKKELEPDEIAILVLRYNSGTYRGSVKVLAHVLYGELNQEANKRWKSFIVGASGKIDPDFKIQPEKLIYDDCKQLSKRISVSPHYDKNLEVTKVSCDKRFFSARLLASNQQENLFQIEVVFDPSEYYPDAGPAHLSISTNSKVQSIALIPIEVSL